ncbi:hypothetical protein [Methanocorpusculum vombati]|uniref:Uncharacterized protein n=1 Tax=Methanocorpusculum vombati TaxID=3002864 RepID=A0ABT4IM31_9EURY|nr:hypothetical protein [Methanocorpusculum vombati]MCZ9313569.1 hypothetical protein [Methanocorpusculum sp.]MCZ0862809.1 hypothetical protein [Methanocorpusculum vombati]MCZ9319703.1 hypothetical protein [Methanocorpusculum sp.]MDE2520723.1 hypothetical protein [Methanocorpusculum sp.]MDE2533771.1 hypothetical protein [Methanocorpusculum sp.]
MNVRRESLPGILLEVLLVIVMAVSGLAIIIRLWQDAFVAIGVELLIISVGLLLLLILFRLRRLEEQSAARERVMRSNLEDLGRQMIQRQDATSLKVVEAVESIKSRMYR